MLNALKMVLGALIVLPFALGIGFVYGIKHQKNVVAARAANDKVVILKDGKQIDEKVFSASDSALCDLLGGC